MAYEYPAMGNVVNANKRREEEIAYVVPPIFCEIRRLL